MTELSDKQLQYGYWFVTHKILLRGILFVILIAANLLIWGWVVFSLIKNFVIDFNSYRSWRYDLLYDRYTNQQMVQQKTQPRAIVVNELRALPAQNKRVDLVAMVANPNESWVGRFVYQFATDKGATPLRKGFIMPGERKAIFDLDVEAATADRVIIQNVVWERFNNYPEYASLRNRFSIQDAQFIPQSSSDGINASRATFSVSNDSNFNYYQPHFVVRLFRQNQLIAINTIAIDSIKSHEARNLEARWFESVPVPDKIEVVPEIDFLNSASYLPIE